MSIRKWRSLFLTVCVLLLFVVSRLVISATSASNIGAGSTITEAEGVGSDFYVAPDGSPAGDGSSANPWDLATALAHPPQIQPGDTIWLRGGTYRGLFQSFLTGNPGAPIVVRSYPGEWAIIDTEVVSSADTLAFRVSGAWTYYWGFELMNSRTGNRDGGFLLAENGGNNKFINLIIHDMGQSNFLRDGNELYGCILYNNGNDEGYGHQVYTSNDDSSTPIRITDSIIFNGYRIGIHAYSEGVGLINGLHLVGNVWFNAGVAQTDHEYQDNLLIGASNNVADVLLRENMGWAPQPTTRSLSLGWGWDNNIDLTLIDNYLVGETEFDAPWQTVVMQGNTFYSLPDETVTAAHPDNVYLTERPAGARIFVRPNQYEPGRAHIVVYNWDLLDTVDVDVSAILAPGDVYEVRNAQNYFAAPVATGVYDLSPVTLPLSGLEPAQPIGPGLIEPSEQTGREFNVFVLIRTGTCFNCDKSSYFPLIFK